MVLLGCILIVAICVNSLTYGAVPKQDEYIPIKYPGPVKYPGKDKYSGPVKEVVSRSGEVPEECASKTYCTIKPADYPQDRFNQMFKGTKPVFQPTLVVDDLSGAPNRQGISDPDYVDNCETEVTYDPLYRVKTSRGWHTVVQAPDENYVQTVRMETCSQENGACFTSFPSLPQFKTYCRQKYSTWEFLVASDDKNGTEKVRTDIPICCCCFYKTVL